MSLTHFLYMGTSPQHFVVPLSTHYAVRTLQPLNPNPPMLLVSSANPSAALTLLIRQRALLPSQCSDIINSKLELFSANYTWISGQPHSCFLWGTVCLSPRLQRGYNGVERAEFQRRE